MTKGSTLYRGRVEGVGISTGRRHDLYMGLTRTRRTGTGRCRLTDEMQGRIRFKNAPPPRARGTPRLFLGRHRCSKEQPNATESPTHPCRGRVRSHPVQPARGRRLCRTRHESGFIRLPLALTRRRQQARDGRPWQTSEHAPIRSLRQPVLSLTTTKHESL